MSNDFSSSEPPPPTAEGVLHARLDKQGDQSHQHDGAIDTVAGRARAQRLGRGLLAAARDRDSVSCATRARGAGRTAVVVDSAGQREGPVGHAQGRQRAVDGGDDLCRRGLGAGGGVVGPQRGLGGGQGTVAAPNGRGHKGHLGEGAEHGGACVRNGHVVGGGLGRRDGHEHGGGWTALRRVGARHRGGEGGGVLDG